MCHPVVLKAYADGSEPYAPLACRLRRGGTRSRAPRDPQKHKHRPEPAPGGPGGAQGRMAGAWGAGGAAVGVSTVCVLLHRSRRSKRRALPLHIRARLCPAPGPPPCHPLAIASVAWRDTSAPSCPPRVVVGHPGASDRLELGAPGWAGGTWWQPPLSPGRQSAAGAAPKEPGDGPCQGVEAGCGRRGCPCRGRS